MRFIILLILSILMLSNAFGGVFIEPNVNSYAALATQTINYTAPTTATAEYEGNGNGIQYGVRAGYIWETFFIGYQVSSTSGDYTNQKITTTVPGAATTITDVNDLTFDKIDNGMLLGWRFGTVFRLWLSSLTTTLEIKDPDGTVTKFKGGTGILGFGWMISHGFGLTFQIGGAVYTSQDGQKYPYTETAGAVTGEVNEFKEALMIFGASWEWGLY